MEYGLRRYEAVQRLLWLLFLILCLTAAYVTQNPGKYPAPPNPQVKDIKKLGFWTGLHGIMMPAPVPDVPREKLLGEGGRQPGKGESKPGFMEKNAPDASPGELSLAQQDPRMLSRIMLFLVRIGLIFLFGRLIWLVVQYLGKLALTAIMSDSIKGPGPLKADYHSAPLYPESFFPRQLLLDKMRRVPLWFLFHPFMRLHLMLSGFQKSVSSEELGEKERRIVETDWQILYNSWGPFRWLLWGIPLLGLVQSGWFFLLQVQDASISQKELLDTIQMLPNSILPLAQTLGIVIFFKLASGLLRRMEDLYLSNLDSMLYDRLLSRLPFQSSDTVIILQTLQRQFQDLHAALKRLERIVYSEKKATEG